jgi:hypothetical protein
MIMKRFIIILALMPFLFNACITNDIPKPDADFDMYVFENYEYIKAESGIKKKPVYFKPKATADFFVIYPGIASRIYADTLNAGFPMINGAYYEMIYAQAGEFDVTIVATNVDDFGNSEQTYVTKKIIIKEAK